MTTATLKWLPRCLGASSAMGALMLVCELQAQDYTYTTNNGTITITKYTGSSADVTIPSTLNGLPVTTIGPSAFYGVYSMTNVTIPNGITNIGDSAFYDCNNLTRISIPDSATYLGDEAFFLCVGATSLTIGKGITSISGGADKGMFGTFESCGSLTSLTIPDNVTNIGDGALNIGGALGAFSECNSLTNVTIGKGLTYLGVGTFSWCTNQLSLYFLGNAPTLGVDMFGEDIFQGDNLATVYYLPGTTGWGPTLAGVPTALWNAQTQTGDGGFGLRQNRFGFNVAGTAGIPLVIEASTNPAAGSWVPVQGCTLTNGLLYFSDAGWTNYPGRFYRIRSP